MIKDLIAKAKAATMEPGSRAEIYWQDYTSRFRRVPKEDEDFIFAATPPTILALCDALSIAREALKRYEFVSVEKGPSHYSVAAEALAEIERLLGKDE